MKEKFMLFVLDFDRLYQGDVERTIIPDDVGVPPSVYVISEKDTDEVHQIVGLARNQEDPLVFFEGTLDARGIVYKYVGEISIPYKARQQGTLSRHVKYEKM